MENRQDPLLVEPVEGSAELASADKIVVYVGENTHLSLKGKTITAAATRSFCIKALECQNDARGFLLGNDLNIA